MKNNKFTNARNKANQEDYTSRTGVNFQRSIDVDHIYDWIEKTNWSKESEYHNTCYNHMTKKYGVRTLKMKNKEWHKLNKN